MAKVGKTAGKPGSKKFDFVMDGKRIENVEDRSIPKPRLYDFYLNNVVPELKKKFEYKNIMQVPKIVKITLNMGIGEAVFRP